MLETAGSAVITHVKSHREAGLGELGGVWRPGEEGRETQVAHRCASDGERQGAWTRMATGFPEPRLWLRDFSLKATLLSGSVWWGQCLRPTL